MSGTGPQTEAEPVPALFWRRRRSLTGCVRALAS